MYLVIAIIMLFFLSRPSARGFASSCSTLLTHGSYHEPVSTLGKELFLLTGLQMASRSPTLQLYD